MFSGSFFDTTLYINLSAIKENYKLLRSKIVGTDCAVTVKANAYGLGIEQISNCLYEAGCRNFFVANLGEAIFLRKLKDDITIYVFHGIKENEKQAFIEYKIIPVLNDLDQINLWNNFGYELNTNLPAILHFDTGINRLGINPEEAPNLAKNLDSLKNLEIKYIMTHFACANEIDNPRNQQQLDAFREIHKFFPDFKASIANSSAIFLGHEYHYDMPRPGAALFGVNPIMDQPNPMNNVIELKSQIIQIKNIKKDGMVGYGNICPVQKGMKLIVVPVGYADGYSRSLTNKGYCYFKGKKLYAMGKISMDMSVFDASEFKEEEINVGDEVEILGKNIDLGAIARLAETIPYEILTSFSNRFKRIYI